MIFDISLYIPSNKYIIGEKYNNKKERKIINLINNDNDMMNLLINTPT